jgi:hypothetical protein
MDQNTSLPLKVLGFIWALPATILIWTFYILPLLYKKEIVYTGKADTFIWTFRNPIMDTWYDNMWHKWSGWSGPCVYIWKDMISMRSNRITRAHELKHCYDQFIFGFFFYPAYIGHSVWLAVKNFFRKEEDKQHIYYDNWFERRARAAAGQMIDIPRKYWPDGPCDYNPWF